MYFLYCICVHIFQSVCSPLVPERLLQALASAREAGGGPVSSAQVPQEAERGPMWIAKTHAGRVTASRRRRLQTETRRPHVPPLLCSAGNGSGPFGVTSCQVTSTQALVNKTERRCLIIIGLLAFRPGPKGNIFALIDQSFPSGAKTKVPAPSSSKTTVICSSEYFYFK